MWLKSVFLLEILYHSVKYICLDNRSIPIDYTYIKRNLLGFAGNLYSINIICASTAIGVSFHVMFV